MQQYVYDCVDIRVIHTSYTNCSARSLGRYYSKSSYAQSFNSLKTTLVRSKVQRVIIECRIFANTILKLDQLSQLVLREKSKSAFFPTKKFEVY